MKALRFGTAVAIAVLLGVLGSCASTELANHTFEGESLRLILRVAPGARVEADYWITIDPEDPVTTVISIGSSIAKASQVNEAQAKMDSALRDFRVDEVFEDEVGSYFSDVMEMRLVESRTRASYILSIEVEEYGIEATGHNGGLEFVLDGNAELIDNYDGRRIWHKWFHRDEQISPSVFGLPTSADNVLTAALLSELSEEEIAAGVERVTRDAAWQVAEEFDADLSWARRHHER
ncbi:MAG: hypothetical protein ACOC2Y_04140 [Spirochaetota bacterium]